VKDRDHDLETGEVLACGAAEAPAPDPRWRAKDAQWFVGKHVKRAFDARNPVTGEVMREHLWIQVDRAG
jgi:hypothetical protein